MKQDRQKVAVVGAGTMGSGIAQLASTHGHETVVVDVSADTLARCEAGLRKIFARLVEKERMNTGDVDQAFDLLTFSTSIDDASGAGLVVEAIVEDLSIKQSVFQSLEDRVSSDCILATNTSSLSVTSVAGGCRIPGRVVGMHFFNPAPLMKLVEVIPGIDTHTETVQSVRSVAESWGKVVVEAKDTPGFIVNRVARSFYSESLRILDEGVASARQIDHALKSIGGFRMGPFELMDLIGNDVNLAVTRSVFTAFHFDQRYKPSFTQERLVEAGRLGRKSGSGYYEYRDDDEQGFEPLSEDAAVGVVDRVTCMIMNEAIDAVFWGVASAEDIDIAMMKGVNYPRGPIEWAESVGLEIVLKRIELLRNRYNEDRYRPSPLLLDLVAKGETLHD